MSRPLTWHNAFNELGSDPVIAKNYQIYFFRYPSGVPVLYSSAKFRAHLALLEKELHRIGNHRAEHNMVLIGHSMGGLVSKMQLTSTGDSLWVNILGAKPSDLGLSRKEYEDFKRLMFDLKPAMWSVFLLIPTGRAGIEELPDAADLERVFEDMADLVGNAPFAVKTTEGHHFRRVVMQRKGAKEGKKRPGWASGHHRAPPEAVLYYKEVCPRPGLGCRRVVRDQRDRVIWCRHSQCTLGEI